MVSSVQTTTSQTTSDQHAANMSLSPKFYWRSSNESSIFVFYFPLELCVYLCACVRIINQPRRQRHLSFAFMFMHLVGEGLSQKQWFMIQQNVLWGDILVVCWCFDFWDDPLNLLSVNVTTEERELTHERLTWHYQTRHVSTCWTVPYLYKNTVKCSS